MQLNLEPAEVQFVVNLVGSVPTGDAMNANMLGLLPKLIEQAQAQQTAPAPPAA